MILQNQNIENLPVPKFHRQRFLLTFLQMAGGSLSKLDFQKLLFLIHQKIELDYYDFVPYKFGCYSFHAQSDIELLEMTGWFETDDTTIRIKRNYESENQPHAVKWIMREFAGIRGRELIKYVYKHYPYYATRSQMAEDIMDKESFETIQEMKVQMQLDDSMLFTIGYEGVTFEKYVNELIKNNVKVLCDVRKNPVSRKFGFSKGIMSRLLPKFGIVYLHLGELGIPTEMRTKLETKDDYNRLFEIYTRTLPDKKKYLHKIINLMREYNRVALTCFEKHAEYCHRHCVSDFLEMTNGMGVTHL